MNPEFHDPNNHAPALNPADEWGDDDPLPSPQLPPKRHDPMKSFRTELVIAGYRSPDPERPGDSIPVTRHGQNRAADAVSDVANRKSIPDLPVRTATVETSPRQIHSPEGRQQSRRGMVSKRKRFRTKDNEEWGRRSKRNSARWMAYVALGVIALIAVTLFTKQFIGREEENRARTPDMAKFRPVEPERVLNEDNDPVLRLNRQGEQAINIYVRYASSGRVQDVIDDLYLGDRNLASLDREWKALGAPSHWRPGDKTAWSAHHNGNHPYGVLKGVNHDFSKFHAFFRFEGDRLKLDWKATCGYGSAHFGDLKTGQGDASEIRGWISPADFYTQALPERNYHSFLFISPKKEASIWVYSKIGSQLDQQLMAMFMVSPITGEFQKEVMVTLSLARGEQQILPRQWMVSQLLAKNWLDQHEP
jgi:hypothetical protein